jgi:hypothetical protein
MISRKKITDLSQPIQRGINFIKITRNINLVGSSSIKELKYIQDYDLNELIDEPITPQHILQQVQQKYERAKKDKTIYISDLKLGGHKWTAKDIQKGYISVDGVKQSFTDLLFYKDDLFKMDLLLVLPNKQLAEITDVYRVNLNGQKNYEEDDEDVRESLKKDIKDYLKEKNYFKMLKRVFSLMLLNSNVNKADIQKFLDFFNSKAGLLYNIQYYYDLIDILEKQNFRKAPKALIKWNLQFNNNRLKQFNIKRDEINETLNQFAMDFMETIK